MPISDEQIIKRISERMYKRRVAEANTRGRNSATMAYAVSVRTGRCYVGYNLQELTMSGTGSCAENRALHVAQTYDERLQDLVFFALNINSEFFNACAGCQSWLFNGRGYLKNQSQQWLISTAKPSGAPSFYWVDHPLSDREREVLYDAGDEVSQESAAYFATVAF
jgi:hypothetical protein